LPVGLELVAARFDDGVLLSLGSAVEADLDMPAVPAGLDRAERSAAR
jgi:hypothetical protein